MTDGRSVEAEPTKQPVTFRLATVTLRQTRTVVYRELDTPEGVDPRAINDTARRALTGEVLTIGTLNWFIDAFQMSQEDADDLLALLRDSGQIKVVRGEALPPPGLYEAVGPPRHHTVSSHELHEIGPDRLPSRHRVIQTVRALEDGLNYYPYSFDTNATTMTVLRHGRPGRIYRATDELYAINIEFPRPLARGQTHTFEYALTFHYTKPPPPEFRRGAFRQVDSLLVEVKFHPEALPRHIWWAKWNTLNHHDVDRQEELQLIEPDYSVHCHHERIKDTIVGFHWEW